jgi:hypothetical protein
MNDRPGGSVHWSFWVIGAFALIWNLMGGINFIMQMDPDMVASMPETHHAIIESRPVWATGGFALGVFGGALGCILLLLRKSSAYYVFIASLIGVIATMIHAIGFANAATAFSPFEIFLMIVMPVALAAFLIWYAKRAESKGWIS